jgi:polysaccharide deacetylase 2 family uncharacterized protein YibQ
MRWRPIVLVVIAFLFLFMIVFLLKYPSNHSPSAPKSAVSASPISRKSAAEPTGPRAASGSPRAALIIDDLGYNLDAIEKIRAIGRPVTVAILPYATFTEESARRAAVDGLEIMLHLPLESAGSKDGPAVIAGTIFEGMPDIDIRTAVERSLAQVPGVRGVNNHTGSLATEDPAVMRPILEVLKARGLYFIDSRTTNASVAFEEAELMGMPAAARQVFIDALPGEAEIAARLRELFRLAQKHGRAVGICHPKSETLAALARQIGLADEYGVRLVFASEIVR